MPYAKVQIPLLVLCCILFATDTLAQNIYYDSTAHSIVALNYPTENVVRLALQKVWPDTKVVTFYFTHKTPQIFSGTLLLTRDTSLVTRKQFLLYMDSVLNSISVIANPAPHIYHIIDIKDSLLLATFEDPSGLTFTEIISTSKGWEGARTYPKSYLHKRYRWKPTRNNDSVDKQLQQMGTEFRDRWLSIDEIHVRPLGVSEDVLLYHTQNYQFHPTIGATYLSNLKSDSSSTYLAGGEVGVIYGVLMSGHGNYGILGLQSSIEFLTNGTKNVLGINAGINTSGFFVIRLRGGVYSDLGRNVTLMALPEIGVSHNGRYGATVGAHLPVLGSNAFSSSFRLSLFYNFLPRGAK